MQEPSVNPMRLVFLGLSITSSWGNGHATNYRALLAQLAARGHDVLFLERDVPWYASNRDMRDPPFCRLGLYTSLKNLHTRFGDEIAHADAVVLGSYVPEGVAVGEQLAATARGLRIFYDIDTPITLARLAAGDHEYLAPHLIPGFDLYLSFTGGPTLEYLERRYHAQRARAFYCMVDPENHYPDPQGERDNGHKREFDLGYLGTYSLDRQPGLEQFLLKPATRSAQSRFIVAGPQYPEDIQWPANTSRIEHLPPAEHRSFYNAQRFTLNITRLDMRRAGYSPSVRLFEAAACGTPIISDIWEGLDELLEPGREILLVRSTEDVLGILHDLDEQERCQIAARARERILREHTAAHRAREFEGHIADLLGTPAGRDGTGGWVV